MKKGAELTPSSMHDYVEMQDISSLAYACAHDDDVRQLVVSGTIY